MAGKESKNERFRRCMEKVQEGRDAGNPRLELEGLNYWIGVAKRFYDRDQLAAWLYNLFNDIDKSDRTAEINFLLEPYEKSGKIHYGEPEPTPPNRLKFKDQR